ncbi:MAG: DUF3142 domain-containing protein [Planctomycetota bacterium]|nr:DUF3142 domain-containing protein [Planctomycetota bacterium]
MSTKSWVWIALALTALDLGAAALRLPHASGGNPREPEAVIARSDQPALADLPQEAYVWQRDWAGPVRESVRTIGPGFTGLVVLAGQVGFGAGEMKIVRVAVDYDALRATGRPIGLALRIGPYAGPFGSADEVTRRLAGLAGELVAQARAKGVSTSELQIDFDCAQSKLDGYRVWVEALRAKVAPLPVRITALPAWLGEPGFARLAGATDGYVLQVHSLEPPARADAAMTLCDPAAALRWAEQADRLGVPFRVALPTYGYLVAFKRDGSFLGLSAEGPSPAWPAGGTVRPLRADAAAMAGLIRAWAKHRPMKMLGVIWYRLPTAADTLNWHASTLAAVMQGREPRARVEAAVERREPGLGEVVLRNAGDADGAWDARVEVTWRRAGLVACDGLGGYAAARRRESAAVFEPTGELALGVIRPGQRKVIGWLRWDGEEEAEAHVATK